jgi:hypothetical protein
VSSAALDRLLAALIVGVAATGALSLVSGAPRDAWVFVGHDLLAGALAVAAVIKLARSAPRAVKAGRWGRLAVAGLVTLVVGASIVGGVAWIAGGSLVWVDIGPLRWTLLTLHAYAGLVLVPLVIVHLLPRRWRVLRLRTRRSTGDAPAPTVLGANRRVSRRSLLLAGGFAAASVVLVGTATALDTLRGGARRFTGSRYLPQGPPGVPTTFLGEATPAVDLATWRLRVTGRVKRPLEIDLASLHALGEREVTATLDCTAGWAIEATWSGVPLARVLARAGVPDNATRFDVVSVTGWRATFPAADARRCLLAWSEGGRSIPAEHGAPVRLVAPDHRGLEWVKWIDRIEVA